MIRFLVMDVDGTLTDGKIYIGAEGEAVKAFDVKDGYGIKMMLPALGITPVVITARESAILQRRCAELGIADLFQNRHDKLECLTAYLEARGASLEEVAYMGDDMLDLQCMRPVALAGGMAACPADAATAVVAACHFIAPHKAGEGAVRDLIEHLALQQAHPAPTLAERLDHAVAYIEHLDGDSLATGRHEVAPDFYYNVMEYQPADEATALYESHRKYIDIQRILRGEERLMVAHIASLQPVGTYDADTDCILYRGPSATATVRLRPDTSVVLYPADGHRAVSLGKGCDGPVKKVVGKLLINP